MKTNYALLLSFEGITLARRTMAGWLSVGEIAPDSDDLDTALQALRRKAQALSSDAERVKLVIPNEQIRYLTLPARTRSADDLNDDIRNALDGETPYPVADLVFDWAELSDGSVQVAAAARETLDEAEHFATTHQFTPVSFVAAAPDGAFHGEVFFGPASGGKNGATPARDTQPVRLVTAKPTAPPPAPKTDEVPEAQIGASVAPNVEGNPVDDAGHAADRGDPSDLGAPVPDALDAPAPETSGTDARQAKTETSDGPAGRSAGAPEAGSKPAAHSPLVLETPPVADPQQRQNRPHGPGASDTPAATRHVAGAPEPQLPESDTPERPARTDDTASDDAPKMNEADPAQGAETVGPRLPLFVADSRPPRTSGTESIRASRPVPDAPVPKLSGARSVPADTGRPAPRIDPVAEPPSTAKQVAARRDKLATHVPDDATAAPIASLTKEPDAPAGPALAVPKAPAAKAGFFSRRHARQKQTSTPPAPPPKASSAPPRLQSKASQMTPVQRRAMAEPMVRGAQSATADPVATPMPTEDEADRLTIFGARRNNEMVGGKPRFLGLIMTAALILFLAAVAAWAAVFVDEGLARFFRSSPAPNAVAQLPDLPAVESVDPSETEAEPETEIASLATDLTGETDQPGLRTDTTPPLAEPAQSEVLTSEEAQATYAATGIWQRTPSEPGLPTQVTLEDIYVASIDTDVQQFDAVALPAVDGYGTDYAMLSPASPAAAGTEFTLDDRGLVIATPQGSLNPDGIAIYSGQPPVVPPTRNPTPDTAAQQTPEDDAQLKALADKRPRARPGDLIEKSERATLAGRSLAELSGLRPRQRPAAVVAQLEAIATLEQEKAAVINAASAQAVNRSAVPVGRPGNFAAIVEKARATPQPAPVTRAASTATVAPRTVAPRVPSSASVAREATVKNQLNLNRVNLIGVYGAPSSRRALIRLSNGRYQKVKVGDRIDGGRVAAIGDAELRYVKSGRNVVLRMPRS